ncbi:hypothetical protein CL653_00785 [bacterium]|nr:hypothetical protein [bacterium]|tara:strand:- start:18 stop:476 length:459 start_codon:yes stop_codon:yes gene_type:complete
MRFEVPQFIEVEDKIFGPFTWKQFLYLSGGLGIAVVIFLTLPFVLFVLLGVPIGSLAILLAFYPVNNRPFSIFLESIFQFVSTNKLYLWRKKGTGIYEQEESGKEKQEMAQALPTYTPTVNTKNLASLSRKLELSAIENKQVLQKPKLEKKD